MTNYNNNSDNNNHKEGKNDTQCGNLMEAHIFHRVSSDLHNAVKTKNKLLKL